MAPGERRLRSQGFVITGLPSPSVIAPLVSKSVAVVGSGASAITFISSLRQASRSAPSPTTVHWITRRSSSPLYTRVANDPLPQRDALSLLANDLISQGGDGEQLVIRHYGGTGIEALDSKAGRAHLTLAGGGEKVVADFVVSATGYRPDNSIYSELQVHECYATSGPMKLAAALMAAGGGGGDCLAQIAPGKDTLRSPEKNFYILGMKSYGRGSAFLLRIGLEQVQMCVELLQEEETS